MIEQSEIDRQDAHYESGYEKGYKAGVKAGYENGYKAGASALMAYYHESMMDGIRDNYGSNRFRTTTVTMKDKSGNNPVRVTMMLESDYKSEMEGGWW